MQSTRKSFLSALLFTVFLSTSAFADVFTHAIIDMPFQVQSDQPWSQVFENQTDWNAFYEANVPNHVTAGSPEAIPPEFDFEKYSIVAGGLHPGYSASELAVLDVVNGTETNVSVLIVTPGAGCVSASVVSWPTIAILIPKPTGEIRIHSRQTFFDCL